MTPAQRKFSLDRVFSSSLESFGTLDLDGGNITFLPHIQGLAENHWMKIQSDAEKLVNEGKLSPFPGASNTVVVYEMCGNKPLTWNVTRIAVGDFHCNCLDFKTVGLCSHALAAAKYKRESSDFVALVRDKYEKMTAWDLTRPQIRASGSGKKPGQQRRSGHDNGDRTILQAVRGQVRFIIV